MYIQALESTTTIKVVETTGENSSYDAKTKTIKWNPNMGLAADNADLSPATILNHELDHSMQHDKNPVKFNKDRNTPDKKYDTKEEKRVITGSEQAAAQAVGEATKGVPTRTNHAGLHYPTAGVASTVPLTQKQLEDKKRNENKK